MGLEVADALCEYAIQPEIFELTDAIGAGLNANRLYFIKQRLEEGRCVVHCGARVEGIAFPDVRYRCEGQVHIAGPFDAVIAALGRQSDRALVDGLRQACPEAEICCLGDASHVGTAMDAVVQAAEFAANWHPDGMQCAD